MAAKQKQYQVTAALATVKTPGGLRYLYQDAFLPADADEAQVEHLLAMGLIGEVKDVAKAAASEPAPGDSAK